MAFNLNSTFNPTGDQPQAINALCKGVQKRYPHQVLLGVTGSGKTFTMANVIARTNLPTLVISHNKTLAAQLYQELRDFFPENAVSYYVSYYDYYQPEAYIPSTDTYIEKETQINEEIDKLRLLTTTNLLTRSDVIVVASVSCIYNIGSPLEYSKSTIKLSIGQVIKRQDFYSQLINLQYNRSDADLFRGSFRTRGDTVQFWPAYVDYVLKISFLNDKIAFIQPIDPISGQALTSDQLSQYFLAPNQTDYLIFPAKHFQSSVESRKSAYKQILTDLKQQISYLESQNKPLESYRLKQKVSYDLEMIQEFGYVNGIENYSRYFDGRKPGDPPFSLLDYFQLNAQIFGVPNFLTFIDESHITVPQIRGMYRGDRNRKQTLIDFGFRLPSALDNRPLDYSEFESKTPQTIFVSATPNPWEVTRSCNRVVQQLIRPTGLLDPQIDIRKTTNQITDLVIEIIKRIKQGQRILVTTLTKRMAEDLTEFLNDESKILKLFPDTHTFVTLPKVAYLHSEIHTLDRSVLLDDLRLGKYDVLVGINLLREGLDLPEVSLVAILNADHEGFLRSTTSLIQVMGRAARHKQGLVIMYADKITPSMRQAIDEVERRRNIQLTYNLQHHITPVSIQKPIRSEIIKREPDENDVPLHVTLSSKRDVDLDNLDLDTLTPSDIKKLHQKLSRQMNQAAKKLDFELAAKIRDFIEKISSA